MKSIVLPSYPKLPRNMNRSCKLTVNQIKSIPSLKATGKSNGEISKILGCSAELVRYWLMSPEDRKLRGRRAYDSNKMRGKIKKINRTGICKELYHRRRKVLKDEDNQYRKVIRRRQYRFNPKLKPYILKKKRLVK